MSVFKCKICGGNLGISDTGTAKCPYCGTSQTLPRQDDEKIARLYDYASVCIADHKWDDAADTYRQILAEVTGDAEIYWSLLMCNYGVLYVEDDDGEKKITINKLDYNSIFSNELYKKTLEFATPEQKIIYEKDAAYIENVKKKYIEISENEEKFDVFICYKESFNGKRTEDSELAKELYYRLEEEGFKVFYSRITLENKLGKEFEPYIFSALESAKVMITVGTRPDYYKADWVMNEWKRFLILLNESRGKRLLIPTYKYMDVKYIPQELQPFQAMDLTSPTCIQDIVRNIKKYVEPKVVEKVVEKETPKYTYTYADNSNIEALLARAELCLEDEDFEKADELVERVLDNDPYNAKAYFIKLLLEYEVTDEDDLIELEESFTSSKNYAKIMKFGDEEIKEHMNEILLKYRNKNQKRNHENLVSKYSAEKYDYQKRLFNLALLCKKDSTKLFKDKASYSIIKAYKINIDTWNIEHLINQGITCFKNLRVEFEKEEDVQNKRIIEECKTAMDDIIYKTGKEIIRQDESYVSYYLANVLFSKMKNKPVEEINKVAVGMIKCKVSDLKKAVYDLNSIDQCSELFEFANELKGQPEVDEIITDINSRISSYISQLLDSYIRENVLCEKYSIIQEHFEKYKGIPEANELKKDFIRQVDSAFDEKVHDFLPLIMSEISDKGQKDYDDLKSKIDTMISVLNDAEKTEKIGQLIVECNEMKENVDKDIAYYKGYTSFRTVKSVSQLETKLTVLKEALESFNKAKGWKNSQDFIDEIESQINEIKINIEYNNKCGPIYDKAWECYKEDTLEGYQKAIELYTSVKDYEYSEYWLGKSQKKYNRLLKKKKLHDKIKAIFAWIWKRIVWISIIIVALVFLGLYVYYDLFPNFCLSRYEFFINNGDYEEGIKELSWALYNSKVQNNFPEYAKKALNKLANEGKYIEAVETFDRINDKYINNKLARNFNLKNDIYLNAAKQYADRNDFYNANMCVLSAGRYSEGYKETYKYVEYKKAENKFDNGHILEAYEVYTNVEDYDTSTELYEKITCEYIKHSAKSRGGSKKYDELCETLNKESEAYKSAKYTNAFYWNSSLTTSMIFEELGDYEDSENLFKTRLLEYLSINKDKAFETAYINGINKLVKLGVKEAKDLYHEVYQTKVTNIVINGDKNSTGERSALSRFDHWYVHYNVTVEPGKSKTIKRVATFPDGSTVTNTETYSSGKDSYWVEYYYNNPYQGTSGTLKVVFYDSSGTQLASRSITIN